jgi:phytochrome-interacting factor 3
MCDRPDQDTLEAGWNDNGHIDMQGQNSKCSKSQWQYTSAWNGGHGIEDGVTPPKPINLKSDASLVAAVNKITTEAHPAHNIDNVDDEMVSWLQYPLDATLERNYCSEFFGELPDSNTQLLKESFGHGATRAMRTPYPGAPGNDSVSNRAATADAAMMLGAGRAAGLLPQTGVEAFSKVRTLHALQPSTHTRWPQPHTNQLNDSNMCATPNLATKAPTSAPLSNPMLPPKIQVVAPILNSESPPGNRPGSMNFSHFSRPAAMVKANLHSLAAGSLQIYPAPSPNAARPKQQQQQPQNHMGRPIAEACTSTGSSMAESTTVGQGPLGSHQEMNVQLAVTEREQSNGIEDSRWQAAPSVSPSKDRDRFASGDELQSTPADQETCRQSGMTSDAVLASSEKGISRVTQKPDVQEPTITSSSGGYGTSAERPKEAAASTKKKSSEREDNECQSEVSAYPLDLMLR